MVMLYQQKIGTVQSNVHPTIALTVCPRDLTQMAKRTIHTRRLLLHNIVIHDGFVLESR